MRQPRGRPRWRDVGDGGGDFVLAFGVIGVDGRDDLVDRDVRKPSFKKGQGYLDFLS